MDSKFMDFSLEKKFEKNGYLTILFGQILENQVAIMNILMDDIIAERRTEAVKRVYDSKLILKQFK